MDLLDHHLLGLPAPIRLAISVGRSFAVVGPTDGPVLAVDVDGDVRVFSIVFLGVHTKAASIPSKTISLSMFLSRWIASTIRSNSLGFIDFHFPPLGEDRPST